MRFHTNKEGEHFLLIKLRKGGLHQKAERKTESNPIMDFLRNRKTLLLKARVCQGTAIKTALRI